MFNDIFLVFLVFGVTGLYGALVHLHFREFFLKRKTVLWDPVTKFFICHQIFWGILGIFSLIKVYSFTIAKLFNTVPFV